MLRQRIDEEPEELLVKVILQRNQKTTLQQLTKLL
jgi:hypothetical protein